MLRKKQSDSPEASRASGGGHRGRLNTAARPLAPRPANLAVITAAQRPRPSAGRNTAAALRAPKPPASTSCACGALRAALAAALSASAAPTLRGYQRAATASRRQRHRHPALRRCATAPRSCEIV